MGLGIAAAAVAASFAFYLPVLAKRPLDDAGWKARLLVFDADCEPIRGELGVPATGEAASEASMRAGTQEARPQSGWCWI